MELQQVLQQQKMSPIIWRSRSLSTAAATACFIPFILCFVLGNETFQNEMHLSWEFNWLAGDEWTELRNWHVILDLLCLHTAFSIGTKKDKVKLKKRCQSNTIWNPLASAPGHFAHCTPGLANENWISKTSCRFFSVK